ncbi:hypothetical protein HGRIS_000372 [Hohenbuehelia grisea]|uniref:Uncharacterized protein n=1 Tax=Hohenbuehelia grisea TaxID=104357 RepID=A0ABR3JSV0_9AGAR
MVANNPLFRKWTLKKFNATVINDIWPEVLFFTLVATMVYLVSTLTTRDLGISTTLLTVLGTVLGLVISFRTSSAYERYQDGRKMWTNITISSRNLAQLIWIHVPSERPQHTSRTMLENVIEKKTMVNLVQAFSVAVKHYLRGEAGVYFQDLYPLICFLPRYASMTSGARTTADVLPLWRESAEDGHLSTHEHPHQNVRDVAGGGKIQKTSSLPDPSHANDLGSGKSDDEKSNASWYRSFGQRSGRSKRNRFDPEAALPEVQCERPLKPARSPPQSSLYDYIPLLRLFKWIFRKLARRAAALADDDNGRNLLGKKMGPPEIESNVPLEICLYLSSYSAFVMKNSLVQPAIATALTNNIMALQDTMQNLERIRNTPLPFAYQAHLRMSLWLYLFFLPFQIYPTFKELTIPGTAFAAFLLLGFLEIGQEIENPFNYDANDLGMSFLCISFKFLNNDIW